MADSTTETDVSPEQKRQPSPVRGRFRPILIVVVALLATCVFIRVRYRTWAIPSGAMIPTLLVKDKVLTRRTPYGSIAQMKRGELIVFEFPENREESFVFRVVGLPGDTVEVRDARVWLNGKPIPRCSLGRVTYRPIDPSSETTEGDLYVEDLSGVRYLTFYSTPSLVREAAGPWKVEPNEVFVLGDNRNNSRDSREWFAQRGGGVPFSHVQDRVERILSSEEYERTGPLEEIRLPRSLSNVAPELARCLAPGAKFE